MPWFPDFVSAVELARSQTRAAGQADPVGQYVDALNQGDTHAFQTVWPGEVVVYDPRCGEMRGHKRLEGMRVALVQRVDVLPDRISLTRGSSLPARQLYGTGELRKPWHRNLTLRHLSGMSVCRPLLSRNILIPRTAPTKARSGKSAGSFG